MAKWVIEERDRDGVLQIGAWVGVVLGDRVRLCMHDYEGDTGTNLTPSEARALAKALGEAAQAVEDANG